jgi:curved DNA-binding protein CbpA
VWKSNFEFPGVVAVNLTHWSISTQAATPEIKRSFRDLARAHHPDRHVGSATAAQSASAELFKRISAAYEALRDGDSRRAYQRAVLAGRAD